MLNNYIWCTKENHATRAKVAWHVLTSPKSREQMDVIDPFSQSKALISKFLVQELQPMNDLLENASDTTFLLL